MATRSIVTTAATTTDTASTPEKCKAISTRSATINSTKPKICSLVIAQGRTSPETNPPFYYNRRSYDRFMKVHDNILLFWFWYWSVLGEPIRPTALNYLFRYKSICFFRKLFWNLILDSFNCLLVISNFLVCKTSKQILQMNIDQNEPDNDKWVPLNVCRKSGSFHEKVTLQQWWILLNIRSSSIIVLTTMMLRTILFQYSAFWRQYVAIKIIWWDNLITLSCNLSAPRNHLARVAQHTVIVYRPCSFSSNAIGQVKDTFVVVLLVELWNSDSPVVPAYSWARESLPAGSHNSLMARSHQACSSPSAMISSTFVYNIMTSRDHSSQT